MQTKYCHACKLDLPVASFGKNRAAKDGLQGQCRSCRSESQKRSEAYRTYQRRYSKANKDRLSERAKARYKENPEPAKSRARAWKNANPERKKELDRLWNQNNRERANKNSREWARKNREKRKEIVRRYAQANKEKIRINAARYRARKQALCAVPYTERQLLDKLLVWNYRCYLCSELLDDTLHWDHVKPLAAGGADMLCNLRPTHGKCNQSKGGKWPLERKVMQMSMRIGIDID